MMRDNLLDLVKHTVPVSAFTTIRIDGDGLTTSFQCHQEKNELVLKGKFHNVIPEFKGLFGIPNITLLNTLLQIPEYGEETGTYTVQSRQLDDGTNQPTNLHIENQTGDFKNDFRFMSHNIINTIEPLLTSNVKTWPVSFVPTVTAQQRLNYQRAVHPDESYVVFQIDKGTVTASLGDVSSHAGTFVFANGVDVAAKRTIQVPVAHVSSVLALTGDKVVQMGEMGVLVTVDSGTATYDYTILHVSK